MPPKESQSLITLLRAFIPHVSRRRKMHFGLLMVLMLIGAIAELVTIGAVIPFIALLAEPGRAMEFELLQRFFAVFGWTRPEDLVLPMTVLFVVVVIVSSTIRLLLTWAKNHFTFGLGYDIGVQLYRKILAQPYSWHIAHNTSKSIAAVNKVQMIVTGVLRPIMEAMIGAVIGLAIVLFLLMVEPLAATIAAAVLGGFYLVVMRLMRLRLRRNGKIIAEAQTARVKAVQEGLGGIREVLLDASQPFYQRHYEKVDQRLRLAQSANNFISTSPRMIIEAVGIVLIVGLAYYLANSPGGLLAALPTLAVLALGAQRLLPLLQQLYNGWSRVMGNRQNFADVLQYLELPDQAASLPAEASRLPFARTIRLEGIGYKYPETDSWVLSGIDLTISRGARIGVAGSTGSGKTTLMDLLMGLLEPVKGRMLIDDQPLTKANSRFWQQRVAHVPQFIFLSDASIAENIAFGVPKHEIDMDRVRDAARRAQIDDFIESRKDGYEACVGERGIQLSGGQRQRVGIARALYKNAEVLVFDEATSALDDETEKAVMVAIEGLAQDLTILLIAHRVTTLRSCDRILILRNGRVEQSGTFEEVFGASANANDDKVTMERNNGYQPITHQK